MENLDRRMLLAGLGLVGAAAAASASAGSLTPPVGPVAPTGKTTTEIEPRTAINATNTPGDGTSIFKITQTGSYYLTGNVIGVSGKNGVVIASDSATLDLNGFALIGVPGSLDGVTLASGFVSNVAIVNGTVRSWELNGVNLLSGTARNCRVSDVTAASNVQVGILAGKGCAITHCVAQFNGADGIATGDGCTVLGCAAFANAGAGILGGRGSTISNCAAQGVIGIAMLAGGTLTNCSVRTCDLGITTGDGCNLSHCTAVSNGGIGISTDDACTITDCSSISNQGDGFAVKNHCHLQGCHSVNNTLNGVSALQGGTIRACQVSANVQNGIVVGNDALVVDNHCEGNGLAAGTQSNIYINGSNCRVDGNAVTGGDRGIATAGGVLNNLIVRNSCHGGTNPYGGIGGANDVGPIGTAATSTSPWANILF